MIAVLLHLLVMSMLPTCPTWGSVQIDSAKAAIEQSCNIETSPLGATLQLADWLSELRNLSFPQHGGDAADINVTRCPGESSR